MAEWRNLMKKVLSILLVVTLAFCCVACSNSKNTTETDNNTTSSTAEKKKDEIITVSINVLNPEEESNELTEEQKSAGFISKQLEGEKATYTIKQSDFDKYLASIEETIKTLFDSELINNPDYPGITKIDYDKDFTNVVIHTDSSKYNSDNTFSLNIIAGLTLSSYHEWNNTGKEYTVSIVDENGNEL